MKFKWSVISFIFSSNDIRINICINNFCMSNICSKNISGSDGCFDGDDICFYGGFYWIWN